MMRRFIIYIMLSVGIAVSAAAQWTQDIFPGYERITINHPDDYSGKVVSTVVRAPEGDCGGDTGILYVHGFNDYFFQKEWADSMSRQCLRFYAVDLRKYGRSLLQGQEPFEVRDMQEYFADIDSALAVMKRDGIDKVVLVGHSTGGLTTSLYMSE
ncbi:MAG: alpha/beta fold hydrolase, partial [Muribaculaceae bacterium]|nr:alpha/beta fold hydrolase [Muribaculaceae bacterium]